LDFLRTTRLGFTDELNFENNPNKNRNSQNTFEDKIIRGAR
jgi:hypothetical protein